MIQHKLMIQKLREVCELLGRSAPFDVDERMRTSVDLFRIVHALESEDERVRAEGAVDDFRQRAETAAAERSEAHFEAIFRAAVMFSQAGPDREASLAARETARAWYNLGRSSYEAGVGVPIGIRGLP